MTGSTSKTATEDDVVMTVISKDSVTQQLSGGEGRSWRVVRTEAEPKGGLKLWVATAAGVVGAEAEEAGGRKAGRREEGEIVRAVSTTFLVAAITEQ